MSILTLSFAATAMQASLKGQDCVFTGVKTDSRQVVAGDLFVALPGARVDGHDYIAEAKERGAVGAVISRPVETTLPIIQVPNTVVALGSLAKTYRAQFQIPCVAITGSCGKTTVKEMLSCILALQGPVLSTQGNLNTEVGVPLTLMRLLPEHQLAVIEMGARQKGDIAYLMSLATPRVSLITNAGIAHVEIFGTEQGIAEAKGEIFESLPSDGVAVINADDPHADYWKGLLKSGQKIITFGSQAKADVVGSKIKLEPSASYFELITDIGSAEIHLSVPGAHMIQNALAAAAAARALGVSLSDIKAGLEQFVPVSGRLQLKRGVAGVSIIDDSYNANPVSMRAALSVLANTPGQKIFVMGDMFELGSHALELHREMGRVAHELGIHRLLGVGALTAAAVQSFGIGAVHYPDRASLIQDLRQNLNRDTTVLVKGSFSMRMTEVVLALTTDCQEENPC